MESGDHDRSVPARRLCAAKVPPMKTLRENAKERADDKAYLLKALHKADLLKALQEARDRAEAEQEAKRTVHKYEAMLAAAKDNAAVCAKNAEHARVKVRKCLKGTHIRIGSQC